MPAAHAPHDERPLVVIGLVGTNLDRRGRGAQRWERWRPTVATVLQPELPVARLELLYDEGFEGLAHWLARDAEDRSSAQVRLHPVTLSDPWDLEEVWEVLYQFARSYPFDVERERYLVHITTGTHVAQICLFLLTESRHLPARLLQTSPLPKGAPAEDRARGTHQIIDLDLSRYDRVAARQAEEAKEAVSFLKEGIETRDPAFNHMMTRLEQVGSVTSAPILLTGPTGAGKTRLARRLFELKQQRRQVAGRLVEVNCATIRGDGAMSALFGHTRGAFTGAQRERGGLLRAADGGVLFLDEVGELGLDEQAMLLRAVESRTFLPVGSDREVSSDFQLIAGTNRDLNGAVAAGRFREDLLARINLWTFDLPGLAERPSDIAPNLDYELDRFAREHGQRVSFSREARAAFMSFATGPAGRWRRNFRDLNAAVTRMGTLAPGGRITEDVVKEELARLERDWGGPPGSELPSGLVTQALGAERAAGLDRFDRVQLEDVLTVCRTSRTLSEAGRRLFAASRARRRSVNDADRLRKYLARFDLAWADLTERLRPTP